MLTCVLLWCFLDLFEEPSFAAPLAMRELAPCSETEFLWPPLEGVPLVDIRTDPPVECLLLWCLAEWLSEGGSPTPLACRTTPRDHRKPL